MNPSVVSDSWLHRVCITGPPRTGKTTLASELALIARVDNVKHTGKRDITHKTDRWEPKHTDDLIARGWSEASEEASHWFDAPGPWIIEGSMAVRALRKWMARNEGKPCDVVIWMDRAKVPRNAGQERMAKGTMTIWQGVLPELVKRGVTIRMEDDYDEETKAEAATEA